MQKAPRTPIRTLPELVPNVQPPGIDQASTTLRPRGAADRLDGETRSVADPYTWPMRAFTAVIERDFDAGQYVGSVPGWASFTVARPFSPLSLPPPAPPPRGRSREKVPPA